MEPTVEKFLFPCVLVESNSKAIMSFVDCNDYHIVLKRNQMVDILPEILQVDPKMTVNKTAYVARFTHV